MSVKVAAYSNPGIIDSVLSDPAEPSNATTEVQRALRDTWGRRCTAEVQSTWPLKDVHIEPFRIWRESLNSRNKWQYGTSDPSVSLLDLALVVSIMGTHVSTHRKKGSFRKKTSQLCYWLDLCLSRKLLLQSVTLGLFTPKCWLLISFAQNTFCCLR